MSFWTPCLILGYVNVFGHLAISQLCRWCWAPSHIAALNFFWGTLCNSRLCGCFWATCHIAAFFFMFLDTSTDSQLCRYRGFWTPCVIRGYVDVFGHLVLFAAMWMFLDTLCYSRLCGCFWTPCRTRSYVDTFANLV